MSVELKFSRANRIYLPSEPVEGKIIIKMTSSISHYGIRLTANGSVNLKVPGGSAGVIESLYGGVKPISIVSKSIEVGPSGRIAPVEFIIESDQVDRCRAPVSPEMFVFYITQDTQKHPLLPELASGGFRVMGKMSTHCSLSDPISGELMVETSGVPIKSIDIHLLRVESILVGENIITETSLIQTTQIADGDVCYNMALPIYVILPRLLTGPTVFAGPFSIEFKVTIMISFESELSKLQPKSDPRVPRLWTAVETLPLELVRTR